MKNKIIYFLLYLILVISSCSDKAELDPNIPEGKVKINFNLTTTGLEKSKEMKLSAGKAFQKLDNNLSATVTIGSEQKNQLLANTSSSLPIFPEQDNYNNRHRFPDNFPYRIQIYDQLTGNFVAEKIYYNKSVSGPYSAAQNPFLLDNGKKYIVFAFALYDFSRPRANQEAPTNDKLSTHGGSILMHNNHLTTTNIKDLIIYGLNVNKSFMMHLGEIDLTNANSSTQAVSHAITFRHQFMMYLIKMSTNLPTQYFKNAETPLIGSSFSRCDLKLPVSMMPGGIRIDGQIANILNPRIDHDRPNRNSLTDVFVPYFHPYTFYRGISMYFIDDAFNSNRFPITTPTNTLRSFTTYGSYLPIVKSYDDDNAGTLNSLSLTERDLYSNANYYGYYTLNNSTTNTVISMNLEIKNLTIANSNNSQSLTRNILVSLGEVTNAFSMSELQNSQQGFEVIFTGDF